MMLSPSRRFGLTANGQAMAVVHESISRPSALAKVFAGDNLPCTFQKRRNNLEGTFLQFDLSAGEVEFARANIRFRLREVDAPRNRRRLGHYDNQ